MMASLRDFRLDDLSVAVIVTDGFEELELTGPARALMDLGARVEILSPAPGKIRGTRGYKKSIELLPDRRLSEAKPTLYQALLLPGGLFNVDSLRADPDVLSFVRNMQAAWHPIMAIGYAIWILISAGLVHGRTVTSVESLQDDVTFAKGNWINAEVAVDYNWLTSRGPYDIPAFNRAMVSLLRIARSLGTDNEPLISPDALHVVSKSGMS